jgi:hypothetical protein
VQTVIIEHVALNELPLAWQAQFSGKGQTRVTVRIEEEAQDESSLATNPLFGLWQDRDETTDVAAFAKQLRAPRYALDDVDHKDEK